MPVAVDGPVSERIAAEVEFRLRRLLLGTSQTIRVREVVRPKRNESSTPKHLQIVITQDNPQIDEALTHPGNPPATAWVQQFNLWCHIMPSELDPRAADTFTNYFAADVRRALTEDDAWWTWDGLAIDTKFGTIENFAGDGTFDGFNLPVIVTYRTDENDPYTVRA